MPLEPEDQRHLTAAEGYMQLGMPLDANAELEDIDPDVRHVPEVLEIRLEIYRKLDKWELMQVVAKKLAMLDPANIQWTGSWAYATRRADCIESVRRIPRNRCRAAARGCSFPLQSRLLRVPARQLGSCEVSIAESVRVGASISRRCSR